MGGGADERVAQRPQEACLVHGASGEGDRLLGGVLGRGHHRKAAHPRRLETLPLGGTTIPPTMTPIDGSSYYNFLGELRRTPLWRSSQNPLTGNSVNKGSLLQVVAERELRLRVRLLIHLEGERAGVFWYLFPLVVVAAPPVGLHPHPVHPIEARRGSSGYGEC